jgi:hypothetical protein
MAGGTRLPTDLSKGKPAGIFVSVREQDRATIIEPVRTLQREGFTIYATDGTGGLLQKHGIAVTILQKIAAGARPNVLDLMHNSQIAMIINTPTRTGWKTDEGRIRSTAVRLNIPMITTATAGVAAGRSRRCRATDGHGHAGPRTWPGHPPRCRSAMSMAESVRAGPEFR